MTGPRASVRDDDVLTDATYASMFGVATKKDREYARAVVAALGRIDPALAAPVAPHPFGALIAAGGKSVEALVGYVERGLAGRAVAVPDGEVLVNEVKALDALDALGQLFVLQSPPRKVIVRLRAVLAAEQDGARIAALAKVLAMGRDDELLFAQLRALADPDPAIVGSAARLVGFGRYAQAVPILRALVSPHRFLESRAVLWALGEIGDARALPELATALSQSFRVEECLQAIGKLGTPAAIGIVLPWAMHGLEPQRVAAWQAMAAILDVERGPSAAVAPLADGLAALIEADLFDQTARPDLDALPPIMRVAMLLCLARLGRKLSSAQVKRALGVDQAQATSLRDLLLRSKQ